MCPLCEAAGAPRHLFDLPEATPKSGSTGYRIDCRDCGTYRISNSLLDMISQAQFGPRERLLISKTARWHSLKGTPLLLRVTEDIVRANAAFEIFVQDHTAKAINAVVAAGEVDDPWGNPVHEVDAATGHVSAESRFLVQELLERGDLVMRTRSRNLLDQSESAAAIWWWERGA
jgi:hypothetical protein